MKKLSIALLMVFSTSAFATKLSPMTQQSQGQLQTQGQIQSQDANTNSSVSNEFEDRQQLNATSAIAPSVTQVDVCPIVSPASSAFSIFLLSVSKTDGVKANPICIAWHLKQLDVVQQLACTFPEYKEAAAKVAVQNGLSNYCK